MIYYPFFNISNGLYCYIYRWFFFVYCYKQVMPTHDACMKLIQIFFYKMDQLLNWIFKCYIQVLGEKARLSLTLKKTVNYILLGVRRIPKSKGIKNLTVIGDFSIIIQQMKNQLQGVARSLSNLGINMLMEFKDKWHINLRGWDGCLRHIDPS